MKLPPALVRELVVESGHAADLGTRSTATTRTDWLGALGHAHPKEVAERDLDALKSELEGAQELFYAADRWALLLVFQALDAGGKDGTIRHVMSGVNPQGCAVAAFRQPSEAELRHDFLWRCVRELPERGRIGIFNRSYYEDVLVVRVHAELAAQPPAGAAKQWKFSPADLAEHGRYKEYQSAYEEALSATSTSWAPWYVVPADHKHAMRALVGGIIVDAIESLDLARPALDDERRRTIEEAKAALGAQGATS